MLYPINPFGSPYFSLLMLSIAGALAAWTRRPWVGGAIVGLVSVMVLPPRLLARAPLILLSFILEGLAVGVAGAALRQGRQRLAALGSMWTGAGLVLFHLYLLTHQPHDLADLIFPGAVLITILVLGSLTAFLLPPDGASSRQTPPSA